MKTIQQLLRQPLKTISGVILVALAVAVLCVCVGQAAVASNMQANLEDICTSSALLTDESLQYIQYINTQGPAGAEVHARQNVISWIKEIAGQYPDVVETINAPGLASAYIPKLTADNHTAYFHYMGTSSDCAGALSTGLTNNNYTQVMLEITLTQISEEVRPYTPDSEEAVRVELTGTAESVLGLQEGYNDPTGYTARMTLVLPNEQALDALKLEVGQRYLVYGMDYTDLDWDLRMEIAETGHGLSQETAYDPPKIEYFDPENMVYYPDDYIDKMGWRELESYTIGWYEYLQTLDNGKQILRGVHLTNLDMERYRSIAFTLVDLSAMDAGIGDTYRTPTIVRLNDTPEVFFSSPEGTLWQQYREYIQINNHSFPVLGVDSLMATGSFATQETIMSSGRQFTREELETGARVCVISEETARLSGLNVGDTITLNYCSIDYQSPWQRLISQNYGTVNPTAYIYGPATEMNGGGETYTIVGLYDKNPPWKGTNSLHDFRVNTVFVPKASVTGEMDFADTGLFLSVALHNGAADAFAAIAGRDGFSEMFQITDQGYASLKTNLQDYEQIARNAAVIGCVIYGILLVLFLIFYPAMQRRILAVMAKVGADGWNMLKYLLESSMGIVIPGTAAGLGLSAILWDRIVGFLTDASRTTLDLRLDPAVVLSISAVQLVLAFLLVALISAGLILDRNLMNRERFRLSIPGLKQLPMATIGAAAFAAIITFSLCTLNASSEAEQTAYEQAYQEADVSVTLLNILNEDPYGLEASALVKELVYESRFGFSLRDYLTEEKYMTHMKCYGINEQPYEKTIWGMNANAEPEELSSKWDAKITWLEGYDASTMDSYSDMYLLVPEHLVPEDWDEETPGIQVKLWFLQWNSQTSSWSQRYFYETVATVAGTYTNKIDSTTIYCSLEPLFFCGNRVRTTLPLQHFSAVIRNNDEIPQIREEAKKYFATEGEVPDPGIYVPHIVFKIQSDTLERMRITMENSIKFNELCTMMVFVLSAGAGFFLGFLMIRSRKREIILMRTLGKSNVSIYVEYALEQMLCIVAGTALGGLVFQWEPLTRLLIFNGIYFAGLSAALILFLNSKLLTTLKEDE